MIDAIPGPEIVARLAGPQSICVIRLIHTDAEPGDPTSAKCGRRSIVIARDYHGDNVRRLSPCSIMLMIEGVRLPRLMHVSNCGGPLQVRHIGDVWAEQLLAGAKIAPSRLDRVIYYPIRHRPACYTITVMFTMPGTRQFVPLGERSATRCYREVNRN